MSNAPVPTFEEMMALFRETEKQSRKTDKQIRELRLSLKEAEERRKKEQKNWNKRFAEFGDRIGELIETMVRGGIVHLFQELGYTFTQCSRRGMSFREDAIDVHGEVDLFLENGDYALLVEVKTKLTIDDIKDHLERIKKYRLYADYRNDKRQFIAAVGGGVIDDNVRDYALKHGLYVILQSGRNIEVIQPEGKPKVW
ncbi:MAG: hypothetical protein FWE67_03535 [Planctomycetaceae bacterium]|nr:hypothetical protein [Planctomycetaceae bacterium]